MSTELLVLGWGPHFESQTNEFPVGSYPARVIAQHRGQYDVDAGLGAVRAVGLRRLERDAKDALDLPAVGDWVCVQPTPGDMPRVVKLLQRTSAIVRRAAGPRPTPQVLAANVDVVLVVTGLDQDFNPRRIERYRQLVSTSGARPVYVLNKADLCGDAVEKRDQVLAIAQGAPVLTLSALTGLGMNMLSPHLHAGETAVLVGSSGSGKSTLTNSLLGNETQRQGDVRIRDGKGQHTTTHRQMFLLPQGAWVIDTPGLREVGLWDQADDDILDQINAIAQACRFRDCEHKNEPGCAVIEAEQQGRISPEQLAHWAQLKQEVLERAQGTRRRHGTVRASAAKKSLSRKGGA